MIVPDEIERLRRAGVTIFSPEDGQRMGLAGMINSVVRECDFDLWPTRPRDAGRDPAATGSRSREPITGAEQGRCPRDVLARIRELAAAERTPVLRASPAPAAPASPR